MSVFATADPDSQHEGICAFWWKEIGRVYPSDAKYRNWASAGPIRWELISKMSKYQGKCHGAAGRRICAGDANLFTHPPGHRCFCCRHGPLSHGVCHRLCQKTSRIRHRNRQFSGDQHKIAEMYQKVETSRLLVWQAAWEADNQMDPTISASIAKFYSTEAALEVPTKLSKYLVVMAIPRCFRLRNCCGMPGCSGYTRGPVRFNVISFPDTP